MNTTTRRVAIPPQPRSCVPPPHAPSHPSCRPTCPYNAVPHFGRLHVYMQGANQAGGGTRSLAKLLCSMDSVRAGPKALAGSGSAGSGAPPPLSKLLVDNVHELTSNAARWLEERRPAQGTQPPGQGCYSYTQVRGLHSAASGHASRPAHARKCYTHCVHGYAVPSMLGHQP